MARKPAKPQSRPSILKSIFMGQVISSDFFARHWLPVVICTMVVLIYITTKYTCQTNMEKIAALEKRLEVVTNEKDRERSRFMGRIRETSMQHLVDSLGLNLHVQPQPPYQIKK